MCPLVIGHKGGVSVPQEVVQLVTPNTVFLLNKADLVPDLPVGNVKLAIVVGQANSWRVSAATGDGMRDFLNGLGELPHAR